MITKGHGPVDYVMNGYDHKKYCISTLLNPMGFHETAITTPVRFWRPVARIFGAVMLHTSQQVQQVGYEWLRDMAEEKHCLRICVTELTERDIIAAHGIVADAVCSARKDEWFRTIAHELVPYLKSVGTFLEGASQETLIDDFAERHTLTGATRSPAWVQLERFKQTGDPKDLE
jgi:hypothetical protein